jgi:hypothetical protein
MINKNAKNREALFKMAGSIRTVFFISLAVNAYEVYGFVSQPAGVRQGLSIALGILGTVLVWQFGTQLRAEKKSALPYWLAAVLAGMIRWIFIDATFNLNVFSILLLSLSIFLTLRIVSWTRNGLLI